MVSEEKDEQAKDFTRLLIVDDNPGIVKALATRLVHQGYECLTALNGHEAMCLIADPGVDVLVTDLDMPYLDGFGLLDLATTFTACKRIVITGSADSAMRCYQEYPGVPVMMKPFNIDHIITAVRDAPSTGPTNIPDAA